MPASPTKANKEIVLIKLDLPIEIPPKLKISPIAAIANDTQKSRGTQEVWQLRPSKVPDSNCVPKKMARAQLIRALRTEIVVFSVIAVKLVLIMNVSN